MRFLRILLSVLFVLTTTHASWAQRFNRVYPKINFWILGVQGNVIDDSGKGLNSVFQVKDTWNLMPYPTRISLEKNIYRAISLSLASTYNQYKPGKIVNQRETKSPEHFYSTELSVKYDLNYYFGPTTWIDPYLKGGFSYSLKGPDKNFMVHHKGTLNQVLGIGGNIWLTDQLGANLELTGNIGILPQRDYASYKQYNFGLAYRFGGYRTVDPYKRKY